MSIKARIVVVCLLTLVSPSHCVCHAQEGQNTLKPLHPVFDPFHPGMWTEEYRPGGYTTYAEIRAEVEPLSTARIRLSSDTFNEYSRFLEQNKSRVRSLLVFGATNEDIHKMSTLDSLIVLELPACKADDFQPLVKLKQLEVLRLSNPNLKQFKEQRLLNELDNLQTLALYDVASLQEAVELPGFQPVSQREKGLVWLSIHAPQYTASTRIDWPEKLKRVPAFAVYGDRVNINYAPYGWVNMYKPVVTAAITVGGYAGDEPGISSTRLRDVIETPGFYDDRNVVQAEVISRIVGAPQVDGAQRIITYDKTDISPLKAFAELTGLTLTGDFHGFDALKDVPLESIYFTMDSPVPSAEEIEALSKHPTLKIVRKNIESATDEVLWQRKD